MVKVSRMKDKIRSGYRDQASIISDLHEFARANIGSISYAEYIDAPIGAATLHPISLARMNGNITNNIAFAQTCIRPLDSTGIEQGRIRGYAFTQFQIILDAEFQDAYEFLKRSLSMLGLRTEMMSIHKDDWSSDVISAYGNGYELRYMNLEIVQMTSFYSYNRHKLKRCYELAYGVDRIEMLINAYDRIRTKNIQPEAFISFNCHNVKCNLNVQICVDNPIASFEQLYSKLKQADRTIDTFNHLIYLIHLFNEIDAEKWMSAICKKLYMHRIGKLSSYILDESMHNTLYSEYNIKDDKIKNIA